MPETLIVRLPNWLGDTVMAVPTIRALGKARRQAKLVLAGPWSGLFVDQDLADVLVAYPRAWSGRLRAADTVRALTPDIAVLLPNSFESAASAWYWRARRRIGFSAGGRDWLLTDRVTVPAPRPGRGSACISARRSGPRSSGPSSASWSSAASLAARTWCPC